MSLNVRPDHISEAEWFSPTLNPSFWDCECEGEPEAYIKRKATQLTCDLCGAQEDEMPDSHQREVAELHPFNDACGYLENYIGDLRHAWRVGVGFWNEMGDGTPDIDPDALDADEQMADYIGQVEKALAELREVKS